MEPGAELGHYTVLSEIGRGGMGVVWKARDNTLGREVAIKTLPSEFAQDADRLARFEREARLLASLNHPNIAAIYGLEEHQDTRFLVLELVEGDTLADRLQHGAIPVEESLKLALQMIEALEAAHEKGVIHRDLKPANVKVTSDGRVKVLDFGLAKAFAGDDAQANPANSPTLSMQATQQGVILGTAAYMSPEQARGRAVDKRADIWAFGVVLYEMLTGRQAFADEDVSMTLSKVLQRDPDFDSLPDGVPSRVRQVLKACLQKDPKQRVSDAQDVRLAFDGVFETVVENVPDMALVPAAHQSRWPWAAAVLAAALVAGAAGWILRTPVAEPGPVIRFDHELAEGLAFRNTGRKSVAVSPDGRQIAYNASDGVYLLSLDSFESRLIPGTGGGLNNLTFSPDGQWMAYWSFVTRNLEKISVNGGAPVVLTSVEDNPGGMSWGVDNVLVYSDGGTIMRVSGNGGVAEPLLPGGAGYFLPQILRGGDAVLFTATTGGVAVQPLDADEPMTLFPGSDARYLPTGHIVYRVENSLYAQAFDVDNLETSGGPVPVVENVLAPQVTQYAVSDSGTLAYIPAAASGGAARSLVWVDLDGTAEPIETLPQADYGNPRLSPDGRRVLVAAGGDLWIYDIASGRPSAITTDGSASIYYYAWSPDGSQVAYTSNRSGNGAAWIQPADGSGEPVPLTDLGDGDVDVESFSPDGAMLAVHYHGGSGGTDILMIPTDDPETAPEAFLATEFGENQTQFSPDGRFVAYVSGRSGELQVYIRPYPGPGATETVSIDGGVEPIWAANGDLFYRHPETHAMMRVAVRTEPDLEVGVPELLFEANAYAGYTGGSPSAVYDVSEDGERFLMVRASDSDDGTEDRPRINVIVNWFTELLERAPVE